MTAGGASVPKAPIDKHGKFLLWKKKSGHPDTAFSRTFQPVIRFLIRSARRRHSVVAFDSALIARILRLLCAVVLKSIGAQS